MVKKGKKTFSKKGKLVIEEESENELELEDEMSEVDEEKHGKFIDSITKIINPKLNKKLKMAENEREGEIMSGMDPLDLLNSSKSDFSSMLKSPADQKTLKTLLSGKSIKKKKNEKSLSLTTSLTKPEVKKIQREVLYNNVKKDVSRWNGIVYQNRLADQLVFPLGSDNKLAIKEAQKLNSEFVPITELEERVCRIVHGPEYVERKKAEIFAKDKEEGSEDEYVRTVEEALIHQSELKKLRAIQSYEMSKAKRKGKIKSKSYHRLAKREKIKKQLKEFEELKEKDPEGAMLKLDELNKSRIEERMSLKHRNTSKWARNKAVRAKYDRESREELADQLKISRDLTVKVDESSDETDVDEFDLTLPSLVKNSFNNPWCIESSNENKSSLYYTGYKKLWEEINVQKERIRRKEAEKQPMRRKQNSNEPIEDEIISNHPITSQEVYDNLTELSLLSKEHKMKKASKKLKKMLSEDKGKVKKSKKVKKIAVDGDSDEIRELNIDDTSANYEGISKNSEVIDVNLEKNGPKTVILENIPAIPQEKRQSMLIDPSHFLEIETSAKNRLKNKRAHNFSAKNESDDEFEHVQMIAEAFEDPELITEFKKLKNNEVEESKGKDVDLNLPGWGSWGGKNIKPKKNPKFIIKAKNNKIRKDQYLPHVILNEKGNEKLKAHQVASLPFPFTRVKDYEKSIRCPVGRTWMPEKAVVSLIAPKTRTKLGAAIQPISEEVLFNTKNIKNNQKLRMNN